MTAIELCGMIICFFAYSFLGWLCECVYCSVPAKHFINRGFLNGPLCPVYGFGALMVILCLTPVSGNIALLFVCGMVVTSVLEYITGWLLETLFHTKWWDYSHYKFNIHGRVCLLNSTLFGIMAVIVMRVLHPFVVQMIGRLSDVLTIWIASSLTTLCVVDIYLSVRTALQLSGKLQALQTALAEAKERTEKVMAEKKLQAAQFKEMSLSERIDTLLEKGEGNRLHEKLSQLSHNHNFMHRRLLDAFPNMQFPSSPASIDQLKEAISKMRLEHKQQKKDRKQAKKNDQSSGV